MAVRQQRSPHDLQRLYTYDPTSGLFNLWEGGVKIMDGANLDAFQRMRVSNPVTLFDSKQIHDNQPLLWDDQQTSGGGTGSSHSAAKAATTISVSASTAGVRTRQTFRRFNYQPGKSMLVFMTVRMSASIAGITGRVGLFDANDGLFFTNDAGTLKVVQRSSVSGSPNDTEVSSANWNIDPMDGTGASGVTIDPTKTQILVLDYEWLGVGRVRMGFVVDGKVYYCHEFLNTNSIATVYMSTPNLPLRYELENDGSGGAATLDHVCASVMSEGGQEKTGILRHLDSGAVASLSSGTTYAILGIRLKSTHLDASVILERISMLSSTANDQADWNLIWNGTIAGSPSWGDQTNSCLQTFTGSSSTTVTGGTKLDGSYFTTGAPAQQALSNALMLGSTIAGVADTIVLAATPITNSLTIYGSLTWRELS